MKIGDVIRELRERQNLSQERLAEKSKCSQQTIGKIEKNKVRKPANLPNIAKALSTSTEDILAQVDEDISEPARQGKRAIPPKRRNRARWPFDGIKYELFDRLTPQQKLEIESLVFAEINKFRAQRAPPTRKSKYLPKPKTAKNVANREPGELYQYSSRPVAVPKAT